jgi:hypothetical protein
MVDIRRNLDIILEDGPPQDGWHPLDAATDIARQLQDAKQLVADLQHKLASVKVRMAGDLALSLRRAKPGLNVAVDKNGCRVGYKTKSIVFSPSVEEDMWRATSPNNRFVREFLQANGRATLLTPDLSILTTAIVNYFSNYYRTLGEDISGTGILMIEEKRATLLDLAGWRGGPHQIQAPPTLLNTRSVRRGMPC